MKPSIPFLVLMLGAGSAWAHGGHAEAGFASGMLHPLNGLDHWMAMLGLGLWSRAARVPVKALLTVAAALLAGALLQPGLPAVEPLLAASVLVAGLMGMGAARLPAMAGLVLAGLFALVHGQAHGHELAGAAALGAILTSLLVMAAGWLAGRSARLLAPAAGVLALAGTGLLALA